MMKIAHRLARLNWIASILFPLAVLLMEVFWLYPWLVWLGKWQDTIWQKPILSLASVILLICISFFVTRFLLNQKWSMGWLRFFIVGGGLVAIFIVVRLEYGAGLALLDSSWFLHTGHTILRSFEQFPHPIMLALPVGAYLWWRGIRLGSLPLQSTNIYRSLLIGIVALVLLIIVWRATLGAGSLVGLASTVAPQVAAFFFFGLVALALSNLQAIQRRIPPEETARLSNRRWLPILFGIVGGIVVVGICIATIFSPEFLALLGRLFDSMASALGFVMRYLLIPFEYIAAGLFYVMRFIINWLQRGRSIEPFQTPEFFEPEGVPEPAEGQLLSDVVVMAIKWTLFAIAAALVIFLLVRAIARFRAARAREDIDEVHESLWSWQGFMSDLRLFLSMLWERFRRKQKMVIDEIYLPSWYAQDEAQGMLDIREIYRRLLWLASYLGIARQEHETPYEYTNRLARAIPGGGQQLGELTRIYIDVRYGEIKPGDKQFNHANNLWKALKKLLIKSENDSLH